MPDKKSDVKIGQLLIDVGAVAACDLTEAMQLSRRLNLPIGRVIVMSGLVSEQFLQNSVEAQSMIRDGLLDRETAIKGLKLVKERSIPLQAVLHELKWKPRDDAVSNRLGEILLDAQMISQEQLEKALETSYETGMPLGGTLVLQGVLAPALLPTVLHVQEQIRSGEVLRDDIVEELKAAVLFLSNAEKSKTGETVPGGNFIKKEFESPLLKSQFTREKSLPELLKPEPADQGKSESLSSGLAPENESAVPSFLELVKIAGFTTDKDIREALDKALRNPAIAGKLLLVLGVINEPSYKAVQSCKELIDKGILRTDQAIVALSALRMRMVPIDESFAQMGIKIPHGEG